MTTERFGNIWIESDGQRWSHVDELALLNVHFGLGGGPERRQAISPSMRTVVVSASVAEHPAPTRPPYLGGAQRDVDLLFGA